MSAPSLFAGIFKAPSKAVKSSTGLFSTSSKFKSDDASAVVPLAAPKSKTKKSAKKSKDTSPPPATAAADNKEPKQPVKRKRASAPADPAHETEPVAAKKPKKAVRGGKIEKGGKVGQASKVASAAAKARQLAAAAEEAEQEGKVTAVAKATKPSTKKGKGAVSTKALPAKPKTKTKAAAAAEKKKKVEEMMASDGEGSGDDDKSHSDQSPSSGSDSEDEEGEEVDTEKVSEEADKVARTIFVGNFPSTTKRKAISALFAQYGAVESVRFRSIPVKLDAKMPRKAAIVTGNVDSERGSAHGYVVFKEESSARAALAHNMKEFQGLHLRVDRAAVNKKAVKVAQKHSGSKAAAAAASQGAPVQYDPARSVFIGNLHMQTEDEELIRFFMEGLGAGGQAEVEGVRVVRDPKTSLGKGIAFVLFKTKGGRRAALGLDGRSLKGRPLRVSVIKSGLALKSGGGGAGGGGGKASASWQGATSSKSGRTRGMTESLTGGGGVGKRKSVGGGGKKGGKRPAVAERKQKQLRSLSASKGRRK